MNIEQRLSRLENLLFVNDEPPPMILIKIANNEKGSKDPGSIQIAVLPGACGRQGETLTRNEGEDEDDFLIRCQKEYSELYDK